MLYEFKRSRARALHARFANSEVSLSLSKIIEWLSVRDYDRAKDEGIRRIVGRYARGNVVVQAGRYMNEADASIVVRRGDKAMAQLERADTSR